MLASKLICFPEVYLIHAEGESARDEKDNCTEHSRTLKWRHAGA
jgi:hypothetical protein